jgi:HEAT repeat protein
MEKRSRSNRSKRLGDAGLGGGILWCILWCAGFWFGLTSQVFAEHGSTASMEGLPSGMKRLLADYRGQDSELKAKAQERLAEVGAQAITTYPILEKAMRSKDWQMRRFSLLLITRFGPPQEMIPLLQRATRDPEHRVRAAAMEALQPFGQESLSAYMGILDQNSWWQLRWQAARAIGQLGAATSLRALPVMKDALEKERDMRVRIAVLEALGEMGPNAAPLLRKTLIAEPSASLRLAAAKALHRMGAQAASAVPELTRAARDEDPIVRQAAALALAQIGPKATPGLLRLLKFGETPQERRIAARSLGAIGLKAATEALPTLIDSLRDPDKTVQQAALVAMGKMGPSAVPPLTQTLQQNTWWRARWYAAQGLAQIGPEARSAIPALVRALKDSNRSVQENAALALAAMHPYALSHLAQQATQHPWWRVRQIAATALLPTPQPTPNRVLRSLERATQDTSIEVGAAAARNLEKHGPSAVFYLQRALQRSKDPNIRRILLLGLSAQGAASAPAAKELGEALRDNEVAVQLAAVRALAEIGGPGAKILRQALAEHPFWRVRYLAANALGRWKRGGRSSQQALQKGLTDADRRVREASINALGELGKDSLQTLRFGMKNEWWFIRARSIRFLVRLKPANAIQLIRPMFDDENEQVREVAVKQMGRLGVRALPSLIEALAQERFPSLRWIAAVEIGRLKRKATPAVATLTQALASDDARVRLAAAEALHYIGPAALPAAAALSQRIKDDDERVRVAVAQALGSIGEQAAKDAIPALKQGLQDNTPSMQEASAKALGQMREKSLDELRYYLMQHPTPAIRILIANALRELAPKDALTLKALTTALSDANTDVRDAALRAVRRISTKSARTLIEKTLLENDWWRARQAAAEALGEQRYPAVLLTLKKGLDDTDTRVRIAVMYAISSFGPRAATYLPQFERLREDPDPSIQAAAERAAQRIRFLINAQQRKP